jgi:LmbE family N-acetylglucosaminyl deacetylase
MPDWNLRETAQRVLRRRLERRLAWLTKADLELSAVVFAPHQDDETLGCGGTIIKKIQAGAEVNLVFLTDGSTSHLRMMNRKRMQEIRESEARQAARVLGLARDAVSFLRFPAQKLWEHETEAGQIVQRILAERDPRQIFIPYRREQPRDHRATNRIVRQAIRMTGHDILVYEYPIWMWQHWPWSRLEFCRETTVWRTCTEQLSANLHLLRDFRCAADVSDVTQRKQDALACHASQMSRLNKHPDWRTLADVSGGDFLACFAERYEIFHASSGTG